MFVRVTYTATINGQRETITEGVILSSERKLDISFHKDIDWKAPIFVILETEDAASNITTKEVEFALTDESSLRYKFEMSQDPITAKKLKDEEDRSIRTEELEELNEWVY